MSPVPRPAEAKVVKAVRATSPLPWRLSQLRTVKGGTPRSRLRASAAVTTPNTVRGAAPGARSAATPGAVRSKEPSVRETLYPPSVTVSVRMRIAGSASLSSTASRSVGTWRYSTRLPITRRSRAPSGCLRTSVYRPSCAVSASRMRASESSRPMPQIPQSRAAPCSSSRSRYIAWCERWKPPTPMCAMPTSIPVLSYVGRATSRGSEPRAAVESRSVIGSSSTVPWHRTYPA